MAVLDPRHERARPIYKNLVSYLKDRVQISKNWIVAEFGIGKFGFGEFYLDEVSKVYGIDIEDYSAFHQRVKFILSDGLRIGLPDNSVHMTVSHSVLEHVGDLDASLSEINRITKPEGILFLTVSPLYFSAYGAHMRKDGARLDNWEHLDPSGPSYLTRNPLPGSNVGGHSLNMLTSSKFLAAVGSQPWHILGYDLSFEQKAPPDSVDRSQCSDLDLRLRGFKFIGRKAGKEYVS